MSATRVLVKVAGSRARAAGSAEALLGTPGGTRLRQTVEASQAETQCRGRGQYRRGTEETMGSKEGGLEEVARSIHVLLDIFVDMPRGAEVRF